MWSVQGRNDNVVSAGGWFGLVDTRRRLVKW